MKRWQLRSTLHFRVNMWGGVGWGLWPTFWGFVLWRLQVIYCYCYFVKTFLSTVLFATGIQKLFNIFWFPTHVSQNISTAVDIHNHKLTKLIIILRVIDVSNLWKLRESISLWQWPLRLLSFKVSWRRLVW